MSDYDIKHPERWLSHAFDRIMGELKHVSPGGRNVALRNAGFRWGRIRHIANGSADTYDAMLAEAALNLGLTKREVQQTLARAIRDGRAEPSPHRIATDADHDTAPRLRIGRSAINPDTGDDPPVPFDLEAAPRTTTMDAQAIWSAAQDWLGTPAERYLKEQRGLPSKKILTDLRYNRCLEYHYLIIPVRDEQGEIVAVQRVSINEDGEPAVYPDGRKRKLTTGPAGEGAFVALDTGPDLIVCDGPEDALSIAAACVDKDIKARVVAALTSPKRFIAEGVTIFADRDGSLDDITKAAIEAGARIALPPEGCKDANDAWIKGGAEAIAQAINKAEVGGEQSLRVRSSADFLSDLKPLEYVISGLLPKGMAYSLTGYAGHGKTTLALQMALSVAVGEFFGERETSQGSVLFLAGENPENVRWQFAAALAARNLKGSDVDIDWIEGRFSLGQQTAILKQKMASMPNLKLVIMDSLQAFFEGDNDNDNAQMVEMAHKVRAISDAPQKPALLVIAHPAGKTPSKDNLVPRGGGGFLNEIDGNLTVWSSDGSQQTLHHSQKFRGAPFDQMEFVMEMRQFDHLTDIKGDPVRLPVSRVEDHVEKVNRENQGDRLLRLWLESVEQEQALSEREAVSQFGVTRHRVKAMINTAKEEKLVRRHAKTYRITQGGKDFLEARNAGV